MWQNSFCRWWASLLLVWIDYVLTSVTPLCLLRTSKLEAIKLHCTLQDSVCEGLSWADWPIFFCKIPQDWSCLSSVGLHSRVSQLQALTLRYDWSPADIFFSDYILVPLKNQSLATDVGLDSWNQITHELEWRLADTPKKCDIVWTGSCCEGSLDCSCVLSK